MQRFSHPMGPHGSIWVYILDLEPSVMKASEMKASVLEASVMKASVPEA